MLLHNIRNMLFNFDFIHVVQTSLATVNCELVCSNDCFANVNAIVDYFNYNGLVYRIHVKRFLCDVSDLHMLHNVKYKEFVNYSILTTITSDTI